MYMNSVRAKNVGVTMLFQAEIMVNFSIDLHTKGQNSANSMTCMKEA